MRAITLIYHDVVEAGAETTSGFAGPAAARYKLTVEQFTSHLDAIGQTGRAADRSVLEPQADERPPVYLTFDDGGASAVRIAHALSSRGWRGHFFVTADRIGDPAFVTEHDVRLIHSLGHVVGSHSCSHPERMSSCSWNQLLEEWARSCERLAGFLGEPVRCASVPGGYYSAPVARAAAAAGIAWLFTSEPTTRLALVDGCRVLGRFSIVRTTRAETVAMLAGGRLVPRTRQLASWNAKKLAKRVGGNAYPRLRRSLLTRFP